MSPSYQPALSLGLSASTIHARVQMQDFLDASPPADKRHELLGSSATEPGTLAGDLATEVTNAVFTDFERNQLFTAIGKRLDAPDLIVTGSIRRFYGNAGPTGRSSPAIPAAPSSTSSTRCTTTRSAASGRR
jgi:hypothetical protein